MKMFLPLLVLLFAGESYGFNPAVLSSGRKYPLSRKYSGGYIRRQNRQTHHPNDFSGFNHGEVPFDETHGVDFPYPIDDLNEDDNTEPSIDGLEALGLLLGLDVRRTDSPDPRNSYTHRRIIVESLRPKQSSAMKSENFCVSPPPELTFADVGGFADIKAELEQCTDMMQNHERYAQFNVRTPKGILFEGPPGCGKTLIARALAGEAQTNFIAVSGAQFHEKYVGVGASRVRELFALAEKHKPCIVFIDEIDAIGRARSVDADSSNSERDNSLNELLVQLDGFSAKPGVLLVAATNRADLLDAALLRPGRIDKRVFIGLPDITTRTAVIELYLNKKPIARDVCVAQIAEDSGGLSCADIENLLNEAMLSVIRDKRDEICRADIDAAIDRTRMGFRSSAHIISNDMADRIAVHEIGHAFIGMISMHHAKVQKVVLNLRSPNAPGYTVFDNDQSPLYTRESLFEHLMVLLAGRLAEEAIYGRSITTGAVADFASARALAEKMVVEYGMGSSPVPYGRSDTSLNQIDTDVIELIASANLQAQTALNSATEFLYAASIQLRETGVLRLADLQHIACEHCAELCHTMHCIPM
jgi:cell division protease FtsH